jgi:predicted RNA-binding protein with PIN domain
MAQDTNSEELAKAENECLQVISAVFLAQALPDLLKEGDMTRIRDIFSEVKSTKDGLIEKYRDSVKPYYESMAKEIMNNMVALQDKEILAKTLTKEAILKLTPKEIDEVMNKIKADPNKTQEEESILQQEAKYRAMYIIPNQKLLEASMKTLLNDLANKLYTILYGTGAIREDIVGKK